MLPHCFIIYKIQNDKISLTGTSTLLLTEE